MAILTQTMILKIKNKMGKQTPAGFYIAIRKLPGIETKTTIILSVPHAVVPPEIDSVDKYFLMSKTFFNTISVVINPLFL